MIPLDEIIRVKLPKDKQVLGVVEQAVGAARFRVLCTDGKLRLCRIPAGLRKKVSVRVGDAVIVDPWKLQGDVRGDIIWRYTKTQKQWLIDKNHLTVEEEF